jgi:hypothetical protein
MKEQDSSVIEKRPNAPITDIFTVNPKALAVTLNSNISRTSSNIKLIRDSQEMKYVQLDIKILLPKCITS